MKNKLFTILILALLSFCASAQKTIAVLTGNNWTFYADFSTALNQCAAGSTIYLPGGVFYLSQSADTIDKPISIIGVGHYIDSSVATTSTSLVGDLFFKYGASNCLINGIQLTGAIKLNGPSSDINYISILRSRITGQISTDSIQNFRIKECVLTSLSQQYGFSTNLIVENSLLSPVFGKNFTGVIFRNNIFCTGLYQSHYCTFENNIFLYSWNNYDNYCVYLNNLFLYPSQGFCGTCNSINNLFNQSLTSTFVAVTSGSFSYNFNYHLVSSSPGKSAGTDGADIGIYGSAYPYKEGAVPANPHISTKLIAPSSAPNGTLPVNIRVIAQDR